MEEGEGGHVEAEHGGNHYPGDMEPPGGAPDGLGSLNDAVVNEMDSDQSRLLIGRTLDNGGFASVGDGLFGDLQFDDGGLFGGTDYAGVMLDNCTGEEPDLYIIIRVSVCLSVCLCHTPLLVR